VAMQESTAATKVQAAQRRRSVQQELLRNADTTPTHHRLLNPRAVNGRRLQKELQARGLDVKGNKAKLVGRLQAALDKEEEAEEASLRALQVAKVAKASELLAANWSGLTRMDLTASATEQAIVGSPASKFVEIDANRTEEEAIRALHSGSSASTPSCIAKCLSSATERLALARSQYDQAVERLNPHSPTHGPRAFKAYLAYGAPNNSPLTRAWGRKGTGEHLDCAVFLPFASLHDPLSPNGLDPLASGWATHARPSGETRLSQWGSLVRLMMRMDGACSNQQLLAS